MSLCLWNKTKLPCCHIFAVQERKIHLLFSPSLFAKHWTKDYMKDIYYKKSDLAAETTCSVSSVKFSAIEFKYRYHFYIHRFQVWFMDHNGHVWHSIKIPQKPSIVAMELASLSLEVGMEEFTRRYNLLKSVRDMWTSQKNAILCQYPGM